MPARSVRTALVAVAIVVAGVAAVAAAAAFDVDAQTASPMLAAAPPAPSAVSSEQVARTPTRRSIGRPTSGPFGARLVRTVMLRDRPGGRILRAIGPRTEFGSQRVLAVVEQRPGWLGVLTHHVANSRTAWIPANGAKILFEPYTLHADLSQRTLVVRREGRIERRITVAIGSTATSTPTGRFAVTDALVIGRAGGPYGCCALALTGRQPNVPQGWAGGDRLAIHGTQNESTLGMPVSSGCLRASENDMRWLIATVPLGSQLRIQA